MSALTEAEKRKLLRERRAAKVKNSASRLNKITGDYSSPEPTNPTTNFEAEDTVPELKPQITTHTTPAAIKKSNRISQAFADPEDEDISTYVNHHANKPPQQQSKVNQAEAEEFQRALQQLLGSQQHQHQDVHNDSPANPFGGDGSQFDLFQQMLGGAGGAGGPTGGLGDLFKGLNGMNGGGDGGNSTGAEGDTDYLYNQELSAYNKEVNDQYKAYTMLTRFLILSFITLTFQFEDNSILNTLESLAPSSNSLFLQIFVAFEAITTTIYALRLFKLAPGEYNFDFKVLEYLDYVPDAYLSQAWKKNVKLMVRYLELGKLMVFDFATVIVLGVLSKAIFG